jgi:hypothetical protein
VAVGGVSTGVLGPESTKLQRITVIDDRALVSTAVGGLFQTPGSGTYELVKSIVSSNQPVDCNFAGCEP